MFHMNAALEPKISKTTLTIHHDKHHAKYVTVANQVLNLVHRRLF
jgi:superoxide dismutase